MSLPRVLEPEIARLENALRGVIDAVSAARYDIRRSDAPDSGLTVDEALRGFEDANRNWHAATAAFEAALDATLKSQPEIESEIRKAQCALSMLQTGFSTEVALVQPLEAHDRRLKLADVPNWPTAGAAVLEDVSFGSGGAMERLRVGTDDDPTPEKPGQLNDDAVGHAIRVIQRQTADAVVSVFVGLAAVPLMDAVIPLPANKEAVEILRDLLEEPASWAVEEVTKELPRGASKWSRWALGKATQLLKKVIGQQRFEALDRLLAKGAATSSTDLVAQVLIRVYDTGDVIDRGEAALHPPGHPLKSRQRSGRGTRLRKLENSNKKWLTPIKLLSPAVGHLWHVPIPLPVPPLVLPAAPAAAAVLLAWALVLGGDQLDSRYPYPNFWKGVVRRAQGE